MMKHSTYTSYDELPLMLSVAEVAAVLGISRAGAYELVHGNEFPALKIGSRLIQKEKLGICGKRSGNFQLTLFTIRKVSRKKTSLLIQIKHLQDLHSALVHLFFYFKIFGKS